MSLIMIALRASTAAFVVTALTGLPDTGFAQTNETVGQLPTLETKQAIETLATQSDLGPIDARTFRNIEQVDKSSERLGDPKHDAKPSAPFIVPNSMILQFKPNASREEAKTSGV